MKRRKLGAAAVVGLVLSLAVIGLHILSQPTAEEQEREPISPPRDSDNRT